MSNELLRIHDENNNCDLVAVANPMGNFHMSTYAEMEDGTVKPVDGWYLFSKMIEKVGSCAEWPENTPLPNSGGYGYFEYYTDNSEEACLSMADKSINTKYLVLDLSEESQAKMSTIRSVLKLSSVNNLATPYQLKAHLITTQGTLESTFNQCTAYDDSGKNYYENDSYSRFHVILDNSLLDDELREVFPKNGIYFECLKPATMEALYEVRCSVRVYHRITQDYIGAPYAIYLTSTGGKVMKIQVANDGTITASEA